MAKKVDKDITNNDIKNPVGHPVEIDINDLIEKFNIYIDSEDDPLIEEFALNYKVNRQYLYELAKENKRLADTITRATDKQRVYLLKQGTKIKTLDANIVRLRLIQPCHGFAEKINISADITQKNDIPESLKNLSPEELKTLLDQAKKE